MNRTVKMDLQGWVRDQEPLMTRELLTLETAKNIRNFHRSFPEYSVTPLAQLNGLSQALGVKEIFVKDESFRFKLNAFKVLGGSYAIGRVIGQRLNWPPESLSYERLMCESTKAVLGELTFITATDGNHGRGVAWTASTLGQRSVVFMPEGTSAERLENILAYGSDAKILPMNYDEAVRLASQMAAEEGYLLIQDTAWDGYEEVPTWVMQGYMTMALEAYEQMASMGQVPTHLFLQAGVGSMAAAVAGFFRAVLPQAALKIVIVESNQADCLFRTARANDGRLHKVTGRMDTIMAGLACGEPSTIGWDVLKGSVDAFISCEDSVAKTGMRRLARPFQGDPKVISGESGAVGVGILCDLMNASNGAEYDAYRQQLELGPESVVLCFSTEGDTDHDHYLKVLAELETR